jgi:hypothetical protein
MCGLYVVPKSECPVYSFTCCFRCGLHFIYSTLFDMWLLSMDLVLLFLLC